jgi:hypothetical protein
VTPALTRPLDLPPTMITEDLWLYVARILRDHDVARILRDHGIRPVGRAAAAGAGVSRILRDHEIRPGRRAPAVLAARGVAAAHEVLGGGTGDA